MMKILYLMRHAKSSWKDRALADHERPLNKRGKKAAPEMGRRLKKKGVRLDAIVSSDARRAVDTAVDVAEILGLSPQAVRQTNDLYHATPDRILDIVYRLNEKWNQVMVVGHNPGMTELVQRFYPEPIANLPTAGIVELRFDVSYWQRIDSDTLAFSAVDYPNNKSPR
jgi:phosphohistidine phosphatase